MINVSVVIVNWNAKNHLINCLESLAENQDGYPQEIIVVDNASSDGSPEIVEKEYPHVKLIRNEENLGFARANNIRIRESTGRYVCLVSSDIIPLESGVRRIQEDV